MFGVPAKRNWWHQLTGLTFRFDKEGGWQPGLTQKTTQKRKQAPRPVLRCAFCNEPVTEATAAIEVAGLHRHMFTNPAGISYEIALYRNAACIAQGVATDEYTWFSGYRWQVALCQHCKSHLGWRYVRSGEDHFYGLICMHLIEM